MAVKSQIEITFCACDSKEKGAFGEQIGIPKQSFEDVELEENYDIKSKATERLRLTRTLTSESKNVERSRQGSTMTSKKDEVVKCKAKAKLRCDTKGETDEHYNVQ